MLVQSFFAGARFPNNSEKSFCNSSFTGEVSTSVNLERWEDADVRLLITTQANNKHLFGGKVTKEDMFEKIAEQFTKPSGCFVKRQRGACKQMGLVANGTCGKWNALFPNEKSQYKFSEIFCQWKTPITFGGFDHFTNSPTKYHFFDACLIASYQRRKLKQLL